MQEIRHDGAEVVTPNATPEDLQKALADARNKSVGVYPPGSKITIAGTDYVADSHGSLRRA